MSETSEHPIFGPILDEITGKGRASLEQRFFTKSEDEGGGFLSMKEVYELLHKLKEERDGLLAACERLWGVRLEPGPHSVEQWKAWNIERNGAREAARAAIAKAKPEGR